MYTQSTFEHLMSYPPLTDYESFWTFSTTRALNKNAITHHPCCDVWTTRNSKLARTSHIKETKWNTLLASLDSNAPDKITALRAKMLEKGWRMPVLMNQRCQAQSLRQSHSKLPFQPYSTSKPLPLYVSCENECHPILSTANNTSKFSSPSLLPTTSTTGSASILRGSVAPFPVFRRRLST